MRHLIFTVLFIFLLATNLSGQKHDYNWLLGYQTFGLPPNSLEGRMKVDFNATPPLATLINSKLNFDSYCGVLSDSSGSLNFYTNGFKLFNNKFMLMENGDSLNPGWQWNFSGINGGYDGYTNIVGPFALPSPGHSNEYILFHTTNTYDPDSMYIRLDKLLYSIIDMNANNGDGKVSVKNVVLIEGDLGWPAACKHGNGRDWWITLYDLSDPEQLTFLLSPDGLTGPFIQQIGPAYSLQTPEWNDKSLFSPDGRTYVRHDGFNGPRIMNFDRCTGLFSNMKVISYPPEIWSWSASFSPDSRFLYLFKPSVVWRMDLKFTNPAISFDTLSRWNYSFCPYPEYTTNWSSQEGPDGKIYSSNFDDTKCLNRIEKPNLPGYAAEMAWGGFSIPRRNSSTTCHFPNYRLGEFEGSPCDTINFKGPTNGFAKTIYTPPGELSVFSGLKEDYTILPIQSAGMNDRTTNDFEPAENLMQFSYRRWLKRNGGKATIHSESINKINPKHE